MAKKSSKHTQKQSSKKQVTTNQPVKETKQSKLKTKTESKAQSNEQVQLLPSTLEEQFNEFGNLLNQINKFSQGLEKGNAFDIQQRKSQLAKKIHQECQRVFKEQVGQAENWVKDAQESLSNRNSQLNQAFLKSRTIFQETNSFKKEQIDAALSIFNTKFDQNKQKAASYENLRVRAQNSYN